VPVLDGGEVVGALGVTARAPRTWSGDDVDLLCDLAATAAELERPAAPAPVHETQLATERAAAELAALQRITARLSGVETLEQVADVVTDDVVRLTDLWAAALVLADGERLHVARQVGGPFTEGGPCWEALAQAVGGRAVLVRDDLPADAGGTAFVPLVLRGRALGALVLRWRDPGPASSAQTAQTARLLAALGDQFAQAVERARLREAEQEARERLEFLAEASRVLSASLDSGEILRDLARLAVADVAQACTVYVAADRDLRLVAAAHADPDREPLLGRPGERAAPGRPEAGAAGGRPVVADLGEDGEDGADAAPVGDDAHLAFLRRLGTRSVIAVPLRAHGETLGVLALYRGANGRRRGPRELAWMQDVAARAATALDNARLYRDRAQLARTLQRSLLPPADPAIPGLEVAARYRPVSDGTKVGGDFYDVFPLSTGSWGVVMGDVAGKGVAAASLTALSRYTVRAAALHLAQPSAVLETLNRAILDADFEERFCTIVYLRVQEADGSARIRLCRGGHPPPLLVGTDGSVRPVGADGTAIGFFPEPDLSDTEIVLSPGETLVLYTDGVLETRSADGVWGEDLIDRVLAGSAQRDAEEVADHLVEAILDLSGGVPRDDVAVLVLRAPAEQRVGPGLEQVLPPEPVAAVRARGMLRDWLGEAASARGAAATNGGNHHVAGPRDDDVLLVATELISNAARVARSCVALRTWRTASAVMVEVTDDGEGFAPHTRGGQPAAFEAESGRGLFLVSALADDVQITSTSSGTAVRCRLELD
jgi:serine phosphatase RsbU (regulator of sigma subunit)/anti-sigma regulatory factor (Ser/Thr protein kinase)